MIHVVLFQELTQVPDWWEQLLDRICSQLHITDVGHGRVPQPVSMPSSETSWRAYLKPKAQPSLTPSCSNFSFSGSSTGEGGPKPSCCSLMNLTSVRIRSFHGQTVPPCAHAMSPYGLYVLSALARTFLREALDEVHILLLPLSSEGNQLQLHRLRSCVEQRFEQAVLRKADPSLPVLIPEGAIACGLPGPLRILIWFGRWHTTFQTPD